MVGERDVLAEALHDVQDPQFEDVSLEQKRLAAALIPALAARGYTLSKSAPDRLTGRAVHAAWRDAMYGQLRSVSLERQAWDTLSDQDRQLDEVIAATLAAASSPALRAHEPDEPHRYRIECEVCGQRGTIRLSVDPERSDPTLSPDRPTPP